MLSKSVNSLENHFKSVLGYSHMTESLQKCDSFIRQIKTNLRQLFYPLFIVNGDFNKVAKAQILS